MIQTSLLTFTIRSRIKISPTSTGQKKAVSMNFLTLSSRLATARRDLASNSDKKPKKRRTFAKKNRLKNREIRKNRINLLLFTFENRRKIKEKSALFGGPYRNSDRQFFYSPFLHTNDVHSLFRDTRASDVQNLRPVRADFADL